MLFRRLLCLLAATIASALSAQDLPGLKVTFSAAGKTDVRSDRLLALYPRRPSTHALPPRGSVRREVGG